MKVIGIDPAPSKETIIYSKDTGFISKQPTELKKYIDDFKEEPLILEYTSDLAIDAYLLIKEELHLEK